MITQLKSLAVTAPMVFGILLSGPLATAESVASKPNTRIDFNKMIEQNNVERQDLQQGISKKTAAAKTSKKTNSDKDKAIDFIDVEVGVGQAPAVVDRRFDSIGEARLVNPKPFLN